MGSLITGAAFTGSERYIRNQMPKAESAAAAEQMREGEEGWRQSNLRVR